MSYAAVLVSLALYQSNESQLEVAGDLAEKFEATLIGAAAAEFAPPLYFADGPAAQRLIDEGEASLAKRLAELEAKFRLATRNRRVQVEWHSRMDFPTRFILEKARSADIIVGAGATGTFPDAFMQSNPADLVMQAGRPLLVVPDGINWLDLRSVLVAWKDMPEARRAVTAALPLLRKAKQVTVAAIPESEETRASVAEEVSEVIGWLARHGLPANAVVSESTHGPHVAARLDRIADDVGAGIVVSGAYGHSRFREFVLGGVTRHLMTQTRSCVLLSH